MNYIKKILLYLNTHLDKIAHMFFGLLIAFISYFIFRNYDITIVTVLGVAYLKQYIDLYFINGRFDIYDFYSTCIGGVLGILMWFIK